MPYFYVMDGMRSSALSRIISIFTAMVILNMSMLMAEISALKLDKDKALIQSIAKLISGASSEEEADGEGIADEDVSVREIDLIFSTDFTIPVIQLSDITRNQLVQNQGIPRFGNYEIYSPPPEA